MQLQIRPHQEVMAIKAALLVSSPEPKLQAREQMATRNDKTPTNFFMTDSFQLGRIASLFNPYSFSTVLKIPILTEAKMGRKG